MHPLPLPICPFNLHLRAADYAQAVRPSTLPPCSLPPNARGQNSLTLDARVKQQLKRKQPTQMDGGDLAELVGMGEQLCVFPLLTFSAVQTLVRRISPGSQLRYLFCIPNITGKGGAKLTLV